MAQPEGFTNPSLPQYVCRLHKCLYGLKQALKDLYNWAFEGQKWTPIYFANNKKKKIDILWN